jgi:hypothetical protein
MPTEDLKIRSADYDWWTLAHLGVGKVISNMVAPAVRNVDAALITPQFAARLRADGLDAARPLRVRRSVRWPYEDVYTFEEIQG